MPTFTGFAEGKTRLTKIPEAFFSDLLSQIKYVEELKVVLYFFWRLGQMEGTFRYLHRQDLIQDARFMEGLGKSSQEAAIILDRALDQAVADNILLEAEPSADEDEKVLSKLAQRSGSLGGNQAGPLAPGHKTASNS